jgi:hypothetical protein
VLVKEELGNSADSVSRAWISMSLALIRNHFPLKASTCAIPSRRDDRRSSKTLIGWLSNAFMAAKFRTEKARKERKMKTTNVRAKSSFSADQKRTVTQTRTVPTPNPVIKQSLNQITTLYNYNGKRFNGQLHHQGDLQATADSHAHNEYKRAYGA